MDSIITIYILLNLRDHHSLTTHSVDLENKWQSYMLSNTSWQHTKAIEQVINDQMSPSILPGLLFLKIQSLLSTMQISWSLGEIQTE